MYKPKKVFFIFVFFLFTFKSAFAFDPDKECVVPFIYPYPCSEDGSLIDISYLNMIQTCLKNGALVDEVLNCYIKQTENAYELKNSNDYQKSQSEKFEDKAKRLRKVNRRLKARLRKLNSK